MKPDPIIGEEDVVTALVRFGGVDCHEYVCTYMNADENCQCAKVARAAISAHLGALSAAGYVVVPREPTTEMLKAGSVAVSRLPMDTMMGAQLAGSNRIISAVKMRARWVAMLDAAPPPQNSDEVQS